MEQETNNNKPRRRARKPNGTYRGDDPATPLNEAWEPTDVDAALPKDVKYTIKPKVSGTSNPTAGKYAKKEGVRPTFGNVRSITY